MGVSSITNKTLAPFATPARCKTTGNSIKALGPMRISSISMGRSAPWRSSCAANQRFNVGISAGSRGNVAPVIVSPPFGKVLAEHRILRGRVRRHRHTPGDGSGRVRVFHRLMVLLLQQVRCRFTVEYTGAASGRQWMV